MKKEKNRGGFLRGVAVVLFASGLLTAAGPVCAQEEAMGITVSHAPGTEWHSEAAQKKSILLKVVIPAAVLAVLFAAGASAGFVFRPRAHSGEKPPVQTEKRAEPPRVDSKPRPVVAPPKKVADPAPKPPVPAQKPVQTPPPAAIKIPAPVSVPEPKAVPPPPSPKPVEPAPVPAAAPVQKPVLQPAPANDDDLIFKHLDLLKKLKNKESL